MKDYHTHRPVPWGGYLCSAIRADWPRVAEAKGMTPCFGIHPWHAHETDAAQIAFDLDDWLCRYPQADVGETGLDASPRHKRSFEKQVILLQAHLGAAFRHGRMAHLHGVHAWHELLGILQKRAHDGTLPRVLLHAWNGSHETACQFLALGAVFSVGLRELSHPQAAERYARIPEGKLFPETDDHPENWEKTISLLHSLRPDLPL